MGALAKMRAKWEREDLWGVPVVAAFLAGVLFIPRTGSPWLDGLLWAVYGSLLMALLLIPFRLRGTPPPGFPVRLLFLLTVFISVQRLFPEGSMADGPRILLLTAIVTPIVLFAEYAASPWRRRAAPGAP